MVEQKADRNGQTLGPYQLIRLLGVGGFGEVYEADHRLLQQKRAIKLLLERHFHDPNQRERFLREARTLATLEHPNILPMLEVGEEGTILYLVMPFYHQGTLSDLLKQRTTPLPLTEVERFFAQMCAAVGYAHTRNIAHLDLKPENMLLHDDSRLILSDFGLAHIIKQGRLEAGSSASWGTPYYMAPEHIRGGPELRSDLYALGIILYQLLTNKRPFMGNTPEVVMMKHLLEAPPPLHTAFPGAPATLEPVVRKALEKKPEDRYSTAAALLADFRAAVGSLSSQSAQPRAHSKPTQPHAHPEPPAPKSQVQTENAKYVAPSTPVPQIIRVGCEIELQNGLICGIPPLGRCSSCGRAFCVSHQAHGLVKGYPNWCLSCQQERQREQQNSIHYIQSGAARNDLLTNQVQHVKVAWVNLKSGLFGRYGEKVTPIGYGWLLGELRWRNMSRPSSPQNTFESYLTILMDVPDPFWLPNPENTGSRPWHWQPFIPVEPYQDKYEAFDIWNDAWEFDSENNWIAAARATRKLISNKNQP